MTSTPPQPMAAVDVTEIRLGRHMLLLARPPRQWPQELARHRLGSRDMASVLAAFRDQPQAVGQLRLFWARYHLAATPLSEAALLDDFARQVAGHRIAALLLPRGTPGVAHNAAGQTSGGSRVTPPDPAVLPVSRWSLQQKLGYVLAKASGLVPTDLVAMIETLGTPEGIAWLAVFAGLELAGDLAGGVGLAANAALIALLWATAGVSAVYGAIAFGEFLLQTIRATSQAELDAAAQDLARAALLLGVAALGTLAGWAKLQAVATRLAATEETAGGAEAISAPRNLRPDDRASSLAPDSTEADLQAQRLAVARQYYERTGWSEDRIADHLRGIDFSKEVAVVPLHKDEVVIQWVDPYKGPGNYFAPAGSTPDSLGISGEGRVLRQFVVTKDTTVLQSTAAPIVPDWSGDPDPAATSGGGTQWFTTDKSAFQMLEEP